MSRALKSLTENAPLCFSSEFHAAYTRRQTGKIIAIRRVAVRETGVSQHDGVKLRAPLRPLNTRGPRGFKGAFNSFMPTVHTFAVRETNVSQHNGGASGASLKPLRHDSALRALSSLRGLRGAPEAPPLC